MGNLYNRTIINAKGIYPMSLLTLSIVMLAMGLLLGFVGAGGSGFMIAILTVGFGYPIHLSMGTALAAMLFTSLSGAISHSREGNIDWPSGLIIGLTGAAAAWLGADVAFSIPADMMRWCTAGMLMLSGLVLWLRLSRFKDQPAIAYGTRNLTYVLKTIGIGLITGFLTGTFGIGSTPFIQIGLMLLLGLSIRHAAGTTLLVILPIAAAAAMGYQEEGSLSLQLLLAVLAGTMTGSYIGAKFTKRVPSRVLKTGMVATPMAAALLLLL